MFYTDPAERADILDHQRRVRVVEQLDAAKARLEAERAQPRRRKARLINALERVDELTARAVALGLIRKEAK